MKTNNKDAIRDVRITLSDDILLRDISYTPGSKTEEKYAIPFSFEFNSSWKVSHACRQCNDRVDFGADYTSQKISYRLIKALNSQNYMDFLKQLSDILHHTELYKVGNVWYLNRTDFIYEYDMQRMSAVTPVVYSCANCNAEYLGVVRVGMPAEPDKANPAGMPGMVEIAQLQYIMTDDGKRVSDLLQQYSAKAE